MKQLTDALTNHIGAETTSLCRCWIIEQTNGSRLGFTDHDRNIVLDGVTCAAETGMEAGLIEEQLGLNVNTTEVSGAIDTEAISAEEIDAGDFDNAKISSFTVNWNEPEQYIADGVFLIGEIKREDGYYGLELRSFASKLDQTRGRQFVKQCQADLGDARCKVNLNNPSFSATGSVSELLGPTTIRVDGIEDFESGWFRHGQLNWTTGANIGRGIEILDHRVENQQVLLHLWQPMPYPIATGDLFHANAGCSKNFETCRSKFANGDNFRGFPHMPGNGYVLGHIGNQDKFDGGPLVS